MVFLWHDVYKCCHRASSCIQRSRARQRPLLCAICTYRTSPPPPLSWRLFRQPLLRSSLCLFQVWCCAPAVSPVLLWNDLYLCRSCVDRLAC